MTKHWIPTLLCASALTAHAKETQPPAIMDQNDRVTLISSSLPLSTALHMLAHLKGLNILIDPAIEENTNIHWHSLPWSQAVYALKEKYHLQIIAKKDLWLIHQQHPYQHWHFLKLAHHTLDYLQAHKNELKTHLSTHSALVLDKKNPTAWLFGTEQDKRIAHQWITNLNQQHQSIKLQVYCLLLDQQGLHDFGFGSSMNDTVAPKQWQTLLHRAGWISMLHRFKAWGIERLLLHWMNETQEEGHGYLLAHPYLTTLSGEEASIETGIKFPILHKNSRGSTSTEYQKALIALKATPYANPDHSIDLTLDLTYDWPINQMNSAPYIQTRHLRTHIILPSQHTWVLGGILQKEQQHTTRKEPNFLALPWLSNKKTKEKKQMLIIMVIPSIIEKKARN